MSRAETPDEATALIADAAWRMLETDDRLPTITEAAELAGVPRATAYRRFPSQTQMLAAVMAMHIRPLLLSLAELIGSQPADVFVRTDMLVERYADLYMAHETQFRALLRVSLAASSTVPIQQQIRRGWRLDCVHAALEPLAGTLSSSTMTYLAASISTVVGSESMVIFKDLWNIDIAESTRYQKRAVRALVKGAIDG